MKKHRLRAVRDALREIDDAGTGRENGGPGRERTERELAEQIRELPAVDRFEMATCHREHACHTAGCIAGLTLTMFREEALQVYAERCAAGAACPDSTGGIAGRILGLADDVAGGLFRGRGHGTAMEHIRAGEAADAIDRVLETNTKTPFLQAGS